MIYKHRVWWTNEERELSGVTTELIDAGSGNTFERDFKVFQGQIATARRAVAQGHLIYKTRTERLPDVEPVSEPNVVEDGHGVSDATAGTDVQGRIDLTDEQADALVAEAAKDFAPDFEPPDAA